MTDKLIQRKPIPSGYIRLKIGTWPNCKQVFEHVYVWEKNFGKLASNLEIHHLNGNKTDNSITNLVALTRMAHRRIHAGWILVGKFWYKRCLMCKKLKRVERRNFYMRKTGSGSGMTRCKPCHIAYISDCRKERKLHDRQAHETL